MQDIESLPRPDMVELEEIEISIGQELVLGVIKTKVAEGIDVEKLKKQFDDGWKSIKEDCRVGTKLAAIMLDAWIDHRMLMNSDSWNQFNLLIDEAMLKYNQITNPENSNSHIIDITVNKSAEKVEREIGF